MTEREEEKLDNVMFNLARCALGSRGAFLHSSGQRRSLSNAEVDKIMHLCPVRNEMHWRRVTWWKKVLGDPGNNVQMLTALLGQTEFEKRENMHFRCPPWLRVLLKDLTVVLYLAGEYVDVQGRYEEQGWPFLFHED